MVEAKTESPVAALEKKLADLEGKLRAHIRTLADRLEGVLDHVYGVNVRPPARQRSDEDYPAEVKPSNEDD